MRIKDDPYQIEVARQIAEAFEEGIQDVFLEAPTGSGKSGIAYFVHRETGYKTCVISHQKVLLDQYEDLLSPYCVTIKGKGNYECLVDPSCTVDIALCQYGHQCSERTQCEYFSNRDVAATAPFMNTTYQFVLSMYDTSFGEGGFQYGKDLYIFDECHNTPSLFTDYRRVRIGSVDIKNYNELMELLKGNPLYKKIFDLASTLKQQLENVDRKLINEDNFQPVFSDIFSNMYHISQALAPVISSVIKDKSKSYFARRLGHINSFITSSCCKHSNMKDFFGSVLQNKEFVLEKTDDGPVWDISVVPLRIDTMFPSVVKDLAPRRLFMSSTIFGAKRLRAELGLRGPFKFIGLPSKFDVENRRVFSIPIMAVNHKAVTERKLDPLVKTAIEICLEHNEQGDSGVIFTPSYSLTKLLYDDMGRVLKKAGMEVLYNLGADGRDEVLEKFKEANGRNKVLISPSFFEGVNFTGDISRFQIIPKVPFKSLGSRYVTEKMKMFPSWYGVLACSDIVQAAGRSVRNESDFAITYILDSNFERLLATHKEYLPQWFKEALLTRKMRL